MQHFLRGVFLKFSRRRPSRSAACADSPTVRFSALHHWHGARQCAPLTGMFETAWQWSRGQCLQQSSYPRRNNRQLPRPIPRRDSVRCRKVPVSDVCTLTVEDRRGVGDSQPLQPKRTLRNNAEFMMTLFQPEQLEVFVISRNTPPDMAPFPDFVVAAHHGIPVNIRSVAIDGEFKESAFNSVRLPKTEKVIDTVHGNLELPEKRCFPFPPV